MKNEDVRPGNLELRPIPWFLRSRWRLVLASSAVLAFVLATPAILIAFQIRHSLHTQAVQENERTARLAARMVDAHLEGLRRYVESYSRRTLFLDTVARHDPIQARKHLDELVRTNPHFDRAFVTDTTGVLWTDYPEVPAVHGQNFAARDWFQGVARRQTTYVSGIYQRAAPPQAHLLAIAVPLRDRRDRVIGYLVGQHAVDTLVRWLAQLELAGAVRLSLIDHHGVLAASNSEKTSPISLAHHALVERALAGEAGSEEASDPITSEPMLVSYAAVGTSGWATLAREPLAAVYRPIAAFQRSVFGVTALFFVGALALGMGAVTVMQRYHRALSGSEERFRALAETANDAIVSADSGGLIVYFNRSAEAIFGYPAAEIVGQPLTRLMPERFHAAHTAGLKRYLSGEPAHVIGKTVELEGRRKDGAKFPLELSIASWRAGAAVYFTGMLRDITRRKQTEREIENLNAGLARRAVELEALNRELEAFSYSVSHDLRAPLRAIDGFSQALLEDYGDRFDTAGRDYLQRVRVAAQRMGQLIDDMLKLARVTRAERSDEDVDLSVLARDVAAEIGRQSPAHNVDFIVAPGLHARADPALLRIALENLLNNAWKFTGREPRARVEFGAMPSNGERVYFVRDNGAGFDMAYAAKLFGAFQRLHDAQEFPGTGIGLATVQRVIHKHGGRVWAEGALGKGATFYFTMAKDSRDG